jgi:putative hydroxymethylpyrimidine transport system substrate-binding protein
MAIVPCNPPRKVAVTLDAQGGAENLGALVADQRGFFADAGLRATVLAPAWPSKAVDYVATGIDDVGLVHLPQVMVAQDLGLSLAVVGTVISQPTTSMIWLKKSKIASIADLRGKTIATAGVPFQEKLLGEILERAGLTLNDVTVKHVSYHLVNALLRGKADAIFGGSWNIEGVALEKRGAQPVIMRVQELGVPAYDELVVITRSECLSKYPQVARGFMTALRRGTAVAVKHPALDLRAIEASNSPDPEATRKISRAQIDATLPLLSRSGRVDAGMTATMIDWMHKQGLIRHRLTAAELQVGGKPGAP